MDRKLNYAVFYQQFSFLGISLSDRKFSFAEIGLINVLNFLFAAAQNLKLGLLQKFNIWSFFLSVGILVLVILGFVFWSRFVSLAYW